MLHSNVNSGWLKTFIFACVCVMFSQSAFSGELYESVFTIDTDYLYNANPNGDYPDPTGYGDFGHTDVHMDVLYDFPEFSLFDDYKYYIRPELTLTLRFPRTFLTLELNGSINDDGISLGLFGVPIVSRGWDEMSVDLPTYVPGKGFYMGVHKAPLFTPPDLDFMNGSWEMDYDEDDQVDLEYSIDSTGDYAADFTYDQYRSYIWMADQGTGISNWFADRIQEKIPFLPLPLDWMREIDLSDFADLSDFQPPLSNGDWEHFGLDDIDLLCSYGFGPSAPSTADIIGDIDGSVTLSMESVPEPSAIILCSTAILVLAGIARRYTGHRTGNRRRPK